MQTFIRLDDGRWLCGPGATQTSESKPNAPFQSIAAAQAALRRYRLSLAVFAPHQTAQGATFFHH